MTDEQLFTGFDPQKQPEYEQELQANWGVPAQMIDDVKGRTEDWGQPEWQDVQGAFDRLHCAFASLLSEGRDAADEDVQTLVADHFALISRFYTPTAAIYAGLGRLYVEHADFRKVYDSHHPRLAEYMAEAMRIFAEERLD